MTHQIWEEGRKPLFPYGAKLCVALFQLMLMREMHLASMRSHFKARLFSRQQDT